MMAFNINITAGTYIGKVRVNNEDNFIVNPETVANPRATMMATQVPIPNPRATIIVKQEPQVVPPCEPEAAAIPVPVVQDADEPPVFHLNCMDAEIRDLQITAPAELGLTKGDIIFIKNLRYQVK